jgi:dihydrofolate reductase
MLRLIAAVDRYLGVANDHGIPWQGKIPTDTDRFHELTSDGIIVMGYGTYMEYDRPLHGRDNFVMSRPDTSQLRPGFTLVPDAPMFFDRHTNDVVWVIGGAALFGTSLPRADELFLTRLDADFHCSKFFPEFAETFELEDDDGPHVESDISFHFETWRRSRSSAR